MIARAKFALLTLDGLVIHPHVDFYRCHILVSKQFLQTERVAPIDQIADRESMAQNMWTHSFASNASAFLETGKELRHPIFSQRQARL